MSSIANLEEDFRVAYGEPGDKIDVDTWARLHTEFEQRARRNYPDALRWLFNPKTRDLDSPDPPV